MRSVTSVVWCALLVLGVQLFTACAAGAPRNTNQSAAATHVDNIVPDSSVALRRTYWTTTSSLAIEPSSGKVDGSFTYIGDGRPSGYLYAFSPPIAVTPGDLYTISGDIDASSVISGRPEWAVMDLGFHKVFAAAGIDFGFKARVSAVFTVPKGVTQVRVLCDTVNAVVKKDGRLIFAHPMLVEGTASAYVPSSWTL